MTLSLLPTVDDSRTNAAFEALMWALSRPGVEQVLSAVGMAVIAESLLDRECSFHAQDDAGFAQFLTRSGARPVPVSEADYVFTTIDAEDRVSALAPLRIGTLAYPDEAATLVAPARFGSGRQLRLTGPGVKGSMTIRIDGIDPSFWQLRDGALRYPLGWDLYLVDGDKVIGLPRSTKIEVL